MLEKYKTITLCGSTKFKDDFLKAQAELTFQDYIVLTPGIYHQSDKQYFDRSVEKAEILDDMHRYMIDITDEIFVINKNGYIGSSTQTEIAYAKSLNKKIRYMYHWCEQDCLFNSTMCKCAYVKKVYFEPCFQPKCKKIDLPNCEHYVEENK